MRKSYLKLEDLPTEIPIFPLARAILLPHARLPLTIFEPRYLQMIDGALGGARVLGMIQPEDDTATPPLQKVGCLGRISSFVETDEQRMLISLSGLCRFDVLRELPSNAPWRMLEIDCARWAGDLAPPSADFDAPREQFLDILRRYLDHAQLSADWDEIAKTPNHVLIDSSAMMSPYGVKEKQALLEAPDRRARAEILIALTEMLLSQNAAGANADIQ